MPEIIRVGDFTLTRDINFLHVSIGDQRLEWEKHLHFVSYSLYHAKIHLKDASSALYLAAFPQIVPLLPSPEINFIIAPSLTTFNDAIGIGLQIDIKCYFQGEFEQKSIQIPCIWRFKWYNLISNEYPRYYLSVQILIEFIPTEYNSLRLYGYCPLYMRNTGHLRLVSEPMKMDPKMITFYSNGWQSWSISYLLGYMDKWPSSPVKLGRTNLENQDPYLDGRYQSEWHTVISDIRTQSALVIGFLTLKDQFSRILMDHLDNDGSVQWLCAISQTDGISFESLNEGLRYSEIMMLSLVTTPDSYQVLTEICGFGGILAKIPIESPILAGWCSWYYYYHEVREEDVLSALEFYKRHREFPIRLIQLDDGYQTAIGDWGTRTQKFNAKFPHGLPWLADQIHSNGFLAGLWIAPFFITKKSEFYAEHADYALRNAKNHLLITAQNWKADQYAIDLSRDEILAHVKQYAHEICESWKFDFLKIDFLYATTVFSAQYHNPTYSRAQILRRGVNSIREGMGSQKILLGCGAPLGTCVGLVDVMRIGTDTAAKWAPYEWLFSEIGKVTIPGLKPALRSTIQRTYMHRTWWINDPDCVVVRENRSDLNMDEILLQLTVFGLSGGQILVSDDEALVSCERLDLLMKILPPYSLPNTPKQFRSEATPLDLFIKPLPTLYAKTVSTSFGDRALIAIINWTSHSHIRNFPLSDLMEYQFHTVHSADQNYVVFDFWREEILGIYSQKMALSLEIPSHGCRYLGLIPISPSSQPEILFLSSTLHISQGAAEIKSSKLTPSTLSINLALPGEHNGYLFFSHSPKLRITSHSHTIHEFKNQHGMFVKIHVLLKEHAEIVLQITQSG